MDEFVLEKLRYDGRMLTLGVCVRGIYHRNVLQPRITVSFKNGSLVRRMPLRILSYECVSECAGGVGQEPDISKNPARYGIKAEYAFDVSYLYFWRVKEEKISIWFSFTYGEEEIEPVPIVRAELLETDIEEGEAFRIGKKRIVLAVEEHALIRRPPACHSLKDVVKGVLNFIFADTCRMFFLFPVKMNRVVFISNRRDDLTGNFEYVYNVLKSFPELDIRFVLKHGENKKTDLKTIVQYMYYCATSRIILVDDYIYLLYKMPRRKRTLLFQFWHACGAFKTFGFSRLDLPGGQVQSSPAHRNYDYTIVSSKKIAKFYEEAFAMSPQQVLATGVPRTDIFFSEGYKRFVQRRFYHEYPNALGKKILLFAPTFRGDGKHDGYYPMEQFNPVEAYEALNGEYIIMIKHHPYVKNREGIPEKYKDVILDLSEHAELNDLLFVTDVLVTDYSSVIFEAALLDIPMLMYVFDLEEYLEERGFYYEYERLLPGKKVCTFEQLLLAVRENDYEQERRESFKERFFDDLDGESSERVAAFILHCIETGGN